MRPDLEAKEAKETYNSSCLALVPTVTCGEFFFLLRKTTLHIPLLVSAQRQTGHFYRCLIFELRPDLEAKETYNTAIFAILSEKKNPNLFRAEFLFLGTTPHWSPSTLF
jgi:hypothetical protein